MSSKDNLTAVLHGINDMRLDQRPIPKPKDDQVLLQMEVTGICGSDVHYMVHGKIGPFVLKKPMVIGHESSGTVVECGKNVKNLKPGDRVAIEPGVPCRTCDLCKTGYYNLCRDVYFCATPPDDGNLCRYYVHAADFCHKLPDNMDFEEGALMEPLAVGAHACKKANIKIGDVVVIFGAGPIGLVTLMTAKVMGAKKILITDIVDHRLTKAKEVGADYTVLVPSGTSDQEVAKKILTALGEEPNKCLDASGVEQNNRVALMITRPAGSIVFIGSGKAEMNLPLMDAMVREVELKGTFRYANDYPTAIEMVRSGKVNVKSLITHHYRLEDTLEAFETAKTGRGNPIKILIHSNPNWKP